MSKKDYEQRERESVGDKLEKTAGIALGVLGATSLLYHSGASKFLSNDLGALSKTFDYIKKDVTSTQLKNLDADAVKDIVNKRLLDPESTLKTIKKESDEIWFEKGKNNLLNTIYDYFELKENPDSVLKKTFSSDIVSELKETVRNEHGKDNDFIKHKLDNFIDDTLGRFNIVTEGIEDEGKIILNKDYVKNFKDETNIAVKEQTEIFNKVLKAKDTIDNEYDLYKNSPEAEQLMNDITDKLFNKDALKERFGNKTFFDNVIDSATDSRAQLKDLIADQNKDKLRGFDITKKKNKEVYDFDFLEKIKNLVEKDPDLGELYLDKELKVNNNGDLLSFKKVKEVNEKVINESENTIWGKIFKIRDIRQSKESPYYRLWTAGEHDVVLGDYENRLLNKPKKSNTLISNNYMYLHNKIFKVNENNLEEIKELSNIKLINGKYGSQINLLKDIMGDVDCVDPEKNKLLNYLDIFSTPEALPIDKKASIGKKFKDPDWIRNISKKIQSIDESKMKEMLSDNDSLIDYNKTMKKINKFFNASTDNLDKSTVIKLQENTKGTTKSLLSIATKDNEDMINSLVNRLNNDHKFINADLISLVKKNISNPKKALDTINIAKSNGVTKGFNYYDLVRRELTKEAMLQHVFESNNGKYNSLIELFNSSKLQGKELNKVGMLSNWAVFQKNALTYNLGVSQKNKLLSLSNVKDAAQSTQRLFTGETEKYSSEYLKFFRKNFNKMVEDHSSVFEKGKIEPKKIIHKGNYYGNWTAVRKGINIKDVLSDLNDSTKAKAYVKQFVAGRDNPKNITTKTFAPYFAVNRLVEPLNDIGFGFSPKNKSSVGNLSYNILTKRALPIMAIGSGLSYLDYRSKAYTGTSLRGGMANGIANVDLGFRKFTDSTGITNLLKEGRRTNVISQYITDDEYQNYDERKQYYESGYAPVRSGRWWSFGSNSEFRGGKTQFFEPNFVLKANSDWYDNSVYGSTKEKWAHSFIPTPRHPLAPIRKLLNPYWLEKKHYWDRPYPVTGKMFEENTPWGPALNATVGKILKPQKKMHTRELGNTFLDVRDLIANENKKIYNKAGNNNLIRLDSKFNAEPITFSPLASPSSGQSIQGTNENTNAIKTSGLANNVQYLAPTLKNSNDVIVDNKINILDKIEIAKKSGSLKGQLFKSVNIPDSYSATNYIAPLNQNIKNQAKGVITPESIFKTSAKNSQHILNNKEALADLKNSTESKQFLQDSMYNANQLLGIYGFMINSTTKDKKSYKLADASSINSFSKKFWDQSIGGFGGGFMEIARRFLPHDNHNIEKVNTIRNTMPDWLPEKFLHGDPYRQLPKGDMRLPGKGYESMYKLHGDMYGAYGAYDRFKILADIAPWSREYKVWRSIASQTTKDPQLKSQMKNIKNRVNEQSRKHDFFNYKFKDVNQVQTEHAIIDKVLSKNTFTVVGNSEIHKLAGINVNDDLNNYIKSGNRIMVKTNKDKKLYHNSDNSINTVVFLNGENLNLKLLKSKKADENKDDNTPAGANARFTPHGISRGRIVEKIAHAPIPFVHNKIMRVETPLESWKRHQIYGTEHSTWSHPIKSFIAPAFYSQSSNSLLRQGVAVGAFALSQYADVKDYSKGTKILTKGLNAYFNPTAVMGGTIGYMSRFDKKYINKGMKIGGALGMLKYSYDHLDQPINSTISFGMTGALITKQFFSKTKSTKEGAMIGAAVGLALSGMKNGGFNKRKMFGPYIPNKTRKQWEIDEYYDRLKYIKYMGLYNKASKKAMLYEHVNIRNIMNKLEYQQKKYEKEIRKLRAEADKINKIYQNDPNKEKYLSKIKQQINNLSPKQSILKAGKYTNSAIAYKYAADSTVYGLKESATWAQLATAIPKNSRDYFLEFAKEKDKKKQKEISKYVSPYYQKILNISWGKKNKKLKSNNNYFKKNFIPAPRWSGWKPDVDLDNIKIKEIKNEGLMLSDFGFYESQLKEPAVKNAEVNSRNDDQSLLTFRKNLAGALNGSGLTNVNVSIEPSEDNKIQIVSNIIRTSNYKLKEKVFSKFNGIL